MRATHAAGRRQPASALLAVAVLWLAAGQPSHASSAVADSTSGRCGKGIKHLTESKQSGSPPDSQYRSLYIQGLRALDLKRGGSPERPREAEVLFSQAIGLNPDAGGLVGPYGTWHESYVPHYYLGITRAELGDLAGALISLVESERQGVIHFPRNRSKCRRLRRLREELRAQLHSSSLELEERSRSQDLRIEAYASLPPLLERSTRSSDEAQDADLDQRLEVLDRELKRVRTRIADLEREPETYEKEHTLDLLRAQRNRLEKDRDTLKQRKISIGELRANQQERIEAELALKARYRKATTGILERGCQPDLREEALSLLTEIPANRTVGGDDLGAYLLLARLLLACKQPEAAAVLLQAERQRGLGTLRDEIDHVDQRIRRAISAARAAGLYNDALDRLRDGECSPLSIGLLLEATETWWRDEPPPWAGGWTPQTALARAYLLCGMPGAARERLGLAVEAGEKSLLLADLEQSVEAQDQETPEPLLRLATMPDDGRVARPGCDSERAAAIDLIVELRLPGWQALGANRVSELLRCAKVTRAETMLGLLGEALPSGSDRDLVAEVLEAGAEARTRRLAIDAAQAYARAEALSATRTCRPAVFRLLERVEQDLAKMPDREDFLDLIGEGQYRPSHIKARNEANCGRIRQAKTTIDTATDLDLSDPALAELKAWLEEAPYSGTYEESNALIIAAHDYSNAYWRDLPGVRADLAAVQAALDDQDFYVEVLENPTSGNFDEKIKAFIRRHAQKKKSRLVLYYAGHGYTSPRGSSGCEGRSLELERYGLSENQEPLGWLVPTDTVHPCEETARAYEALLGMDQFAGYRNLIQSTHALFVLDTCFGGTVFRSSSVSRRQAAGNARPKQLIGQDVRMFLTAGNETEKVADTSMFRDAFVGGLGGEADVEDDGIVLGRELGDHILRTVTATTPVWGKTSGENGDILFFRRDPVEATTGRSTPTAIDLDLELWDVAMNFRGDSQGLATYLEIFPDGAMAPLARLLRAYSKEVALLPKR